MDWNTMGTTAGIIALLSLIVKESYSFARRGRNGNAMDTAVHIEHRLTTVESDVRYIKNDVSHIKTVIDELRAR